MSLYKRFIRPILFLLPPESVHHLTFSMLKAITVFPGLLRIVAGGRIKTHKTVKLLGLDFPHMVGLAAGLDKNGVAIRPLKELGFAFIELGTVTPLAQKGNDKPRLFRLPSDRALINRMGFNNFGVDSLVQKLKRKPEGLIIGGNIGKNTLTPNSRAADDYAYCFQQLYDYVDYFVVNISCPNITDLRELQDKSSLSEILWRLLEIRRKQEKFVPILLKVSPDLNKDQLLDLVDVVKETGIDGLVATNTSVGRENLSTDIDVIERIGNGGLSGKPLSSASSRVIEILRQELPKPFPIIASGGIMSPQDAVEKIEAGADLVQIYTGFIYEGPSLIRKILKQIN